MSDCLQITTLSATQEEAERIAVALVESQVAACVQVLGPVASTYRWQGQIERSAEWMCVIKTTRERYAAVEHTIRTLHSYQLPEIIATPVVAGSADYLAWVRQETASGPLP